MGDNARHGGTYCTDDDHPNAEDHLQHTRSTKLTHCAQDCVGEWTNPNNPDGACEQADTYESRMANIVGTVCGGVAPSAVALTVSDCQDLVDQLNGVGDATSPCGFNLAVESASGASCTPACTAAIASVRKCVETCDIFAGAVQYEVYDLARDACNGGSTQTCSGQGETRQLACGALDCVTPVDEESGHSYAPDFGVDIYASDSGSCGAVHQHDASVWSILTPAWLCLQARTRPSGTVLAGGAFQSTPSTANGRSA